jgi:predicted negative regulator of RcsB-dependent stress response
LEGILRSKLQPFFCFLLVVAVSGTSLAQATKAQLEISETFFSLATALNSCGYDAGLQDSLPLRQAVRTELQSVIQQSVEAKQARSALCQFWTEHQQGTENDVTPYLSLALNLGPPPQFAPTLSEADMAPDAGRVLGIISLLQKFYRATNLHTLWVEQQAEYESLVTQLHDPVSHALTDTDLYLKVPFNNYPGQRFVLYLEPMLSPDQVDSRNFGANYYMVISPDKQAHIRFPEIRHTYLHFVLDPMAQLHGTALKQLEPILEDLHKAPMATSFKNDISLMVNECLIRAIEARTTIPKSNEEARNEYVQRSVEEGFVLTRFFYEQLGQFEKESTGMQHAYGNMLHTIDLDRERKKAREVTFLDHATPEIVSAVEPAPSEERLLNLAEQKLAAGDREGAEKLANQVAQHNHGGDAPGHAAFILARIATLSGKMEEARVSFEQAVHSVQDPRILAWSHIYLGRIYDIQQNRDVAVEHYKAALAAGDPATDTRTAAEKGLMNPYQAGKTSKQ